VPYVWSDQYDAKFMGAGRPRPGDQVRVVEGSLAERRFVALFGREGRLAGVVALNRARRLMEWRRLLQQDVAFDAALANAT